MLEAAVCKSGAPVSSELSAPSDHTGVHFAILRSTAHGTLPPASCGVSSAAWAYCYPFASVPLWLHGSTSNAPHGRPRCASSHPLPSHFLCQFVAKVILLLSSANNQTSWNVQVTIGSDGKPENVGAAVRRGRQLKCKDCGDKGATLGCHVRSCHASWHLPCARASHCRLEVRMQE